MAVYCLMVILLQIALTSAFQWTSGGILPNGTAVPACPGQDVTLAWSYTAAADEHLNNVEWYFTAPGGIQTLMATQVAGNFFATASFSQVQFLPNAGIRLLNVGVAARGTYSVNVKVTLHGSLVTQVQTVEVQVSDQPLTTDGQLHVDMLMDAVYDNSTQQFHVQLACGQFLPVWQSRARVVWKTPSSQSIPSNNYDNGRFLLSVPNPVVSGEYTCVIDDNSPASLCVQSGSPLQRGATIALDGMQAQMLVVNAQMEIMQQKEQQYEKLYSALQTQLSSTQQKNSELETKVDSLQQKNAALETQMVQENIALRQRLDAVQQNLTSMINIAGKSVSFHARRTSWATDLDSGDTLKFDEVMNNQGNAYDATSGVFTAPLDGVYAFFVTIVTDDTSPSEATSAYLQTDNLITSCEVLSTYEEADGHRRESNGCSAVVYLHAGQRVSVKSDTDNTRFYPYSYFSGALLHANMS